MRFLTAGILLCLWGLLSGCITVYNPATERKELILINTPQEVALGNVLDKKMSFGLKLIKDAAAAGRLERVGRKVVNVSDRKDLVYHFKVVESKDLNAFALPGGFLYVNSGLMEAATDDELACVIAHEVGHVAAKHAVKRLQAGLGYQLLVSLALRNVNAAALSNALNIMQNLITLGYSRQDEREADKLSVRYAYRSGYKPEAMISFFNKLLKQDGRGYHITLLSSHPAVEERIENIKAEIRKVKRPNGAAVIPE